MIAVNKPKHISISKDYKLLLDSGKELTNGKCNLRGFPIGFPIKSFALTLKEIDPKKIDFSEIPKHHFKFYIRCKQNNQYFETDVFEHLQVVHGDVIKPTDVSIEKDKIKVSFNELTAGMISAVVRRISSVPLLKSHQFTIGRSYPINQDFKSKTLYFDFPINTCSETDYIEIRRRNVLLGEKVIFRQYLSRITKRMMDTAGLIHKHSTYSIKLSGFYLQIDNASAYLSLMNSKKGVFQIVVHDEYEREKPVVSFRSYLYGTYLKVGPNALFYSSPTNDENSKFRLHSNPTHSLQNFSIELNQFRSSYIRMKKDDFSLMRSNRQLAVDLNPTYAIIRKTPLTVINAVTRLALHKKMYVVINGKVLIIKPNYWFSSSPVPALFGWRSFQQMTEFEILDKTNEVEPIVRLKSGNRYLVYNEDAVLEKFIHSILTDESSRFRIKLINHMSNTEKRQCAYIRHPTKDLYLTERLRKLVFIPEISYIWLNTEK